MAENSVSPDPLDERRLLILSAMREEASFDGWTEAALHRAAKQVAETAQGWDEANILAPDLFPEGIRDVFDFWAQVEDWAMRADFETLEEPPQRIRDKITWLVRRRIEGLTPHREAARRAAATLALPIHGTLGPRLAWRTAGEMWRALGDSSTDGNYYTKRATLSAVYLSTLARWFADDSEDGSYQATWEFLDKRIDNVMQFEKLKAQTRKQTPDLSKLVGELGKFRYGKF